MGFLGDFFTAFLWAAAAAAALRLRVCGPSETSKTEHSKFFFGNANDSKLCGRGVGWSTSGPDVLTTEGD